MTAKEKLHQVVEGLSEPEAEQALDYIERRRRRDPLIDLLDNAPPDDEPATPEEEKGVREARAEYRRGEVFTAEDIGRGVTPYTLRGLRRSGACVSGERPYPGAQLS